MYLNANNTQRIFLNNFSFFKLFDGIFWDRCKIGTMFRIFVASCKISFLLSLSLSLIILRLIEEEKKRKIVGQLLSIGYKSQLYSIRRSFRKKFCHAALNSPVQRELVNISVINIGWHAAVSTYRGIDPHFYVFLVPSSSMGTTRLGWNRNKSRIASSHK